MSPEQFARVCVPIPNYDTDAGIHYGVIALNSLQPEAADELCFGPSSVDLGYLDAVDEFKIRLKRALEESGNDDGDSFFALMEEIGIKREDQPDLLDEFLQAEEPVSLDGIEQDFNDAYAMCCDEVNWAYEADGYSARKCLDYNAMLIKAPYFTYAPGCSPCVPNAGDLDNAASDEPWPERKTYCFGHDWFEGGEAPYAVFSVESGERVYPKP